MTGDIQMRHLRAIPDAEVLPKNSDSLTDDSMRRRVTRALASAQLELAEVPLGYDPYNKPRHAPGVVGWGERRR
jgi:hypothetical protein